MSNDALNRILKVHGQDLLHTLADRLAPSDLQTLLMEVADRKVRRRTPQNLLDQYESNRFLHPSPVEPEVVLNFDQIAFRMAKPDFESIEISPLSPFGVTAALTSVSQNNVVATTRNTEVLSDPTNAMALECAVRRRRLLKTIETRAEPVRLCCSSRVVRAQPLIHPKSWAHFRLFALTSSGRDQGSYRFETEELGRHIGFYLRLLEDLSVIGFRFGPIRVVLTNFDGESKAQSHAQLLEDLSSEFPKVSFQGDSERTSGRSYYSGSCFQVFVVGPDGEDSFLADGGITDWTQKLLGNKKERLMISGIGTERLCSTFTPDDEARD